MPRRGLMRQVIPVYLLVLVLSTVVVAWFAGEAVRAFHEQRIGRELQSKAGLLVPQIRAVLEAGDTDVLWELCREWGGAGSTQITVFGTGGGVLGDSRRGQVAMQGRLDPPDPPDPPDFPDPPDQPEVLEAMAGRIGRSVRYSPSLGGKMMYVSVPIRDGVRVAAVVRTAVSLDEVRGALANVYRRIALGGVVTAVVAVVVTLVVFDRRINRPLRELREGAQRFGRGELRWSLPVPDTAEIGTLVEVLNRMAAQLDEKIQAVTRESRERDAILAGMVEGVVAVDNRQLIITLNQSAARLIDVPMTDAVGRRLYEVIRHPDLQALVGGILNGPVDRYAEQTIRMTVDGQERFLDVHGSPLRDAAGRPVGAVVVLYDVTRLRRLEMVRRDFVANVSHELKTPITTIKGAAETLAVGDCDPSQVARFAGMISRQSDRLNAIVEDLLSLARIEQESEQGRVELVESAIEPVLVAAADACKVKAELQEIDIIVDAPQDLVGHINAHLLEQAVVNLIDNAVKYSPSGTRVRVEGTRRDQRIVVSVTDQGAGIESEHQGRIFERFYRTDRARSRDAGGTGLGLAIVKHIAQAHGGHVDMDSKPGVGSVFRIWLPGG